MSLADTPVEEFLESADDRSYGTRSISSTISSGSRYSEIKAICAHQQEKLSAHSREIRMLYIKYSNGSYTTEELREGLSNLGIQCTAALDRALRGHGGATVQYSKFLRALMHINEEDLEMPAAPIKPDRRACSVTPLPFGTMADLEADLAALPTPSRGSDVLAWTTPEKEARSMPSRKASRTSYQDSPLPTYQPAEYQPPTARPVPFGNGENENEDDATQRVMNPQERNALIQAFLAQSISAERFLQELEAAGIRPSATLHGLVKDREHGRNVRFLDVMKEITFLLEEVKRTPNVRPPPAQTHRATVNIYDMENAPAEQRVAVPHSKEQSPALRPQTDLFTWAGSDAQPAPPTRRIGANSHKQSADIYDRTPEPLKQPIGKSPQRTPAPVRDSDIFGWSTPTTGDDPRPMRKKTDGDLGVAAVPWGTENDALSTDHNPHSHYLSKLGH